LVATIDNSISSLYSWSTTSSRRLSTQPMANNRTSKNLTNTLSVVQTTDSNNKEPSSSNNKLETNNELNINDENINNNYSTLTNNQGNRNNKGRKRTRRSNTLYDKICV
jgi:hypothetical protein